MTLKFISNLGKLLKKTVKKTKELVTKKQPRSPRASRPIQPIEQDPKIVVKLKRFNRKLQAKGRALKNQEDQFNLK